ncbi:cytochrome b5 [Rhizodiscina lignyota]|uniref:Cytochrome b5 n=1 Tax=Rhizodiscina lignyota TaxID=1504668 RepID=A0A9P4IUS5_9PEZI|nr:cytochrome b5 [Rhizodiscina lignyota]
MSESSSARQRKGGQGVQGTPPSESDRTSSETESKHSSTSAGEKSNVGGFGVLDVIRILGGLLLLSSALSYFVTQESITWGWRPWFSKPQHVMAWLRGPVLLTDEELKGYDGSIEGRPIYVGLNGSIYDVTAGARVYGPGGGYHFFAGRDAARAFVTGCFAEDQTPDLRGVEEMFVPIDDDSDPTAAPSAEVETGDELKRAGGRTGVKKSELKIRREKELREGRKKVQATIEGWAMLFRGEKGKPYFKVGEIVREEGWMDKLPRRELCEHAQKSRPQRKDMEKGAG